MGGGTRSVKVSLYQPDGFGVCELSYRSEAVDAVVGRRGANTASDVRADSEAAAAKADQGAFPARGAARGQRAIEGIHRHAEEVGRGFEVHLR